MQITQVHYQKLVNLGDYENERFGAWATVEQGEVPEEALEALKQWVLEQGDAAREVKETIAKLQVQLENLEFKLRERSREYEQMAKRWTEARDFLEKLGLKVPAYILQDNDIPF